MSQRDFFGEDINTQMYEQDNKIYTEQCAFVRIIPSRRALYAVHAVDVVYACF